MKRTGKTTRNCPRCHTDMRLLLCFRWNQETYCLDKVTADNNQSDIPTSSFWLCVYVVGWVGNCTRQVFCTLVQTRKYAVTVDIDTRIYDCDHTRHRVYICTRICAFGLFVLSNLCSTCACTTGVFKHLHAWVRGNQKQSLFQLVHVWGLWLAWGTMF